MANNFKFSSQSLKRLDQCHPLIRVVLKDALKNSYVDFSVVCGHRGEEAQNKAYNDGYSHVKFPHSKHNQTPSLAVDLIPVKSAGGYGANDRVWNTIAKTIKESADKFDCSIAWGGDWKNFKDKPHWEIKLREDGKIMQKLDNTILKIQELEKVIKNIRKDYE